jgi:hypothetical protein
MFGAAVALAQGPNMAEMTKWSGAKAIHYHVVGEFKRPVHMGAPASGYYGVADVTDRVEIDFDWSLSKGKLIGEPQIKNFPASLSNLHNGEPKCAMPTLHGTWEYDLKSIENSLSARVLFNSETRIPAIDVPQFCTGAPTRSKERIEKESQQLAVPSPVLLAMGVESVSPDGKTLVVRELGSTYTFTPSVVN